MNIPVSEAKRIADAYGKAEVVIVGVDERDGNTYFATYGVSADNKLNAALAAEICAKTLGCDMDVSKVRKFEDFRDGFEAAKYRALQEKHDEMTAMIARFLIPYRSSISRVWLDLFVECGAVTIDWEQNPHGHVEPVKELP